MSSAPRRPRILFCFGYPDRLTGAQRQTAHLVALLGSRIEARMLVFGEGDVAEHLRAEGHAVTVVAWPGRLGWFGKRLLQLSTLRFAGVLLRDAPALALKLRRVVAAVDLVHLVDYRAGLAVGPIGRLMRKPVVGHLQGEPVINGALWSLYRRLPHVHVANAHAVARSLGSLPAGRVRTVYTSIADLTAAASRPLADPGPLTVACFSSLVPFKGQHVLLEAVARLRGTAGVPAFRVWFAGQEPADYRWYREFLDDRVRQLGLRDIEFLGWRPDARELTRRIDLCVVPSLLRAVIDHRGTRHDVRGNDGMPTVIFEAMSLRKPVVASAITGIPEQVDDGRTGFLVPPGDPVELADRLRQLLESAELRARLGAAGLDKYVREFSHDGYRDGFADIYSELLGPRFVMGSPALSAAP